MSVIKVIYFQRKPRQGFNFSLEYIYNDIRSRLKNKIDSKVFISRCYNDGYFSKVINITEAGFRQGREINHITGEIHFLNLLMRKNNVILTILDCGMLTRKKGVLKKFMEWLYISLPVARARFVTAISEETKREILAYSDCKPEKIKVIPVAVSPIYQPFPKIFNEKKPVIMQIGTGYNKNLFRLIKALTGLECHLTIIGKLNTEHIEALETNNIEYSNEFGISNERLLEKYYECDILSFISTSEGFGMPIIEANAVERVVITSNISSMPEVAGKAACLVDPFNIENIRKGFLKIMKDSFYRQELIREGRKNKMRFNGDVIADMYYDLYTQMVQQ